MRSVFQRDIKNKIRMTFSGHAALVKCFQKRWQELVIQAAEKQADDNDLSIGKITNKQDDEFPGKENKWRDTAVVELGSCQGTVMHSVLFWQGVREARLTRQQENAFGF